MSRTLVLAILAIAALQTSFASAQGHHGARCHKGFRAGSWPAHSRYHADRYDRSAVYSRGTIFGFSIGTVPYGYDYAGYPDPYFLYPYSYDPWARGSFRAPDLLDDPYFYDRVPRTVRSYDPAPHSVPRSYRVSPALRDELPADSEPLTSQSLPQHSFELLKSLQEASEELLLSLGEYGGGDGWVEYLAPNRVIEWAFDGKTNELRELLSRYEQVLQNPEFQVVAEIPGFRETQELLSLYLSQAVEA
jgi:hypothetical protein